MRLQVVSLARDGAHTVPLAARAKAAFAKCAAAAGLQPAGAEKFLETA